MKHEVPQGPTGHDPLRERLEQRLAFEHLIAALSTDFINAPPEGLDGLVERALGRIGTMFEVDRAYLFCFRQDRAVMTNTHEWVAEGISREAQNLQEVPFSTFPWLMKQLVAGEDVHVPDTAALPAEAAGEREEFLREGIRSLAIVPFGNDGAPEGFIGFDSVRRRRHWPAEIMVGLRLVGQMIFNAFRARELSQRLSTLAFHDPLTGLGNRRLLQERLTRLLQAPRVGNGKVALVLIDLDDFKLVNDSFGHSLGDEVLRAVARRLSSTLRQADMLARLGGDEFVLALEVAGPDDLALVVDRLFRSLADPVRVGSMQFSMRMSIGLALHPDDGDDAESLLRQADTAMYSAKAGGKNRFAFFSEEMTRASRATLQLRQDLRAALERGDIRPWYQPRVALPSRRVVGFEALARWQHPVHGLLLPSDFLGLAEQAGLLGEVDFVILQQALRQLGQWQALAPDCRVSVNLSARDLHDQELMARMEACVREHAAVAAGLEFEITESSLIVDVGHAAQSLERLRAAAPGVSIAIDDFGSGYSSLAYLGRLPVGTLKIDRCFTTDIGNGCSNARAVVRALVELSRGIGVGMVIEGVETERQAELMASLGCSEAQGFLFAPPLEAEAATRLLSPGAAGGGRAAAG